MIPAIREFLDRLHQMLDGSERPLVDRDHIEVTTHDTEARVVIPHREPDQPGIEIEVGERYVFVTWTPERQRVTGYDDALRVIEALLDGRVELVVTEHFVYRKRCSSIDGRLFLTTRMPALTFRSGTERRRFF
ncbi:MAG: hypothetical protein SGJ13_08585 [Actinomycetota bacterium]|nr:hypothetical protein [Actinomycetota bacterium]